MAILRPRGVEWRYEPARSGFGDGAGAAHTAQRLRGPVHVFRTWFTPGSVVLAMLVALLWLHRLPLSLAARESGQMFVVCLTFAGLWALTGAPPPRP